MVEKKTEEKVRKKKVAGAIGVGTHGRVFKGKVTKKFDTRVVLGFERTIRVKKYERFSKRKTKLHARLPEDLKVKVHVGDIVKVRECRPLSKIIHFVVIEVLKDKTKEGKK